MPEMADNEMKRRLLGIDPGEKRIGISISDLTGTISRPLIVIQHASYASSAQAIVTICREQNVGRIIVGITYTDEGEPTYAGRRAQRLGEAIAAIYEIPLEYWDESDTTKAAQQSRREMGISRKKRRGHLDDVAACILLQSYIDAHFEKEDMS